MATGNSNYAAKQNVPINTKSWRNNYNFYLKNQNQNGTLISIKFEILDNVEEKLTAVLEESLKEIQTF